MTDADEYFRRVTVPVDLTPENVETIKARAWKTEALTVLAAWDEVWEALGRPGPLGSSKAAGALDEVEAMKQGVAERNSLIGWLIMSKSYAQHGQAPVWPLPAQLEDLFQQLSVSMRDDWDDWRWSGISRPDPEGT